jgi:cysteine desulfurase
MLVNQLDQKGLAVDSGSACNSSNMEPSHVLAAMGLLTHGNIRLTLQPQITEEEVDPLLHALKEIVKELRE